MKSSTQTLQVVKTVYEDQPVLTLTFTPEELKALLALGGTSHITRVGLLDKCNGPHNSKENNNECSHLLAEIYFAASDFNRNQKLAGT
jgi:hypothetical protein